jgi:TatA/E family protein of Tat protein translocase
MPLNLSTGEILLCLLVAVVVFGGRLPSVARKVGSAISDFKRGMRDEVRRMDDFIPPDPPPGWSPPRAPDEEPDKEADKEAEGK